LWGRFSQPAGIVYARDEAAAAAVSEALARAVMTLITRVLPCLPGWFTSRDLWRRGLELSYRAELRSEQSHRQVRLYDANSAYFDTVTRPALGALPWPVTQSEAGYRATVPMTLRKACIAAWRLRRLQGKLLSALRLAKGMLTFEGGVEYVRWKIERHTGVTADVAPRLRRIPLLAAGVLAWRVYRRGGFR
jgi:hypothetical protein